jgi:hypothetical protein
MRYAVVAVALALLASACGGSKHPSSATGSTGSFAPSVRAAAAKTAKAGSEHMTIVAATEADGQNVRLSGGGDFDSAKHVGSLRTTIALATLQPVLDEVLSGQTAYVRTQLLAPLLPAGKTWLKIDLASAGKAFGLSKTALEAQDPSAALTQLKSLTDVQKVGTETVDGVQTTHFRGRIATTGLSAAEQQALTRSGTAFGPADVWVGSDGYVHRVRIVTTAKGVRTTATVTLSKFGEGVIVDVPSAADTIDASKVAIPGLGG